MALYLKGMSAVRTNTDSSVCLGFFENAMEADPTFALPYYEFAQRTNVRSLSILRCAQTLSVVQPKTELAGNALGLLLQQLEAGDSGGSAADCPESKDRNKGENTRS